MRPRAPAPQTPETEKNLPSRRRPSPSHVLGARSARRSRWMRALAVPALAAPLALVALPAAAFATSGSGSATFVPKVTSTGTVRGTVPASGMNVVLMAAKPGAKAPVSLGSARTTEHGEFELHYRGNEATSVKYLLATRPGGAAEAGFPIYGRSYRLGLAIGAGEPDGPMKITERTTVAMGFAMAQFIGSGDRVAGRTPD